MLNNIALKLIKILLNKSLDITQRNQLSNIILDNLDALPIRGIINIDDEGQILINGRSLDLEKAMQLREASRVALENKALQIVNEQVTYTAVVNGINKAITPEQMNFNKAAIWFGQEQERLLKILAQRVTE